MYAHVLQAKRHRIYSPPMHCPTCAGRAGRRLRLFGSVCLAAAACCLGAQRTHAGTTVTITDCQSSTLVTAVKNHMSGDTIDLKPGCTYTFSGQYMSTGDALPPVADVLTINGAGDAFTASATGFRAVEAQSGADLALDDLSVSGFTSPHETNGGAILIDSGGTATIAACSFSSNAADEGSGGAIADGGTLAVTSSFLSGNAAQNGFPGGALFTARGAAAAVNDSSLTGNTAADVGGAIQNDGTMTLSNSTLAGNGQGTAAGGAIENAGGMTLSDSTLSANRSAFVGGAIDNTGTMTLTNTIVDASGSTGGGTCHGTLTDGGYNLEYDNGNPTTCGFSNHAINNLKPLLGNLLDNGGATPTMALLPSSPAVDAGDDTVCATAAPPPVTNTGAGGADQRGVPRPQGKHCDIGAFEVDQPSMQLTSSPATPSAGQPLTLTATVTPSTGNAGTPVGTVMFSDGSTVLGSKTLPDGPAVATWTTTPSAGTHVYRATYAPGTSASAAGNGFFAATGTLQVTAGVPVPSTGAAAGLPVAAPPLVLGGGAVATVVLGAGLRERRDRARRRRASPLR